MVSATNVLDSVEGEAGTVGAADALGNGESSAEGETGLLCAADAFNSSRTVSVSGVVLLYAYFLLG